jgi:hypothetical protein
MTRGAGVRPDRDPVRPAAARAGTAVGTGPAGSAVGVGPTGTAADTRPAGSTEETS